MSKISICDGREYLYQWDTGVVLNLIGCSASEMHFVTPGGIIVRQCTGGRCAIPDAALQTAGTLKFYERVYVGGERYTLIDHKITVLAREKPANYIDPQDEGTTLDIIVDRLKTDEDFMAAVTGECAEQVADDAREAAESAAESAQNATDAQTAAQDAAQSAAEASLESNAAMAAQAEAETAAGDAAASAAEILGAQAAAEAARNGAEAAATNASGSAAEATAAQAIAQAAQTAAETAQAGAEAAATAAVEAGLAEVKQSKADALITTSAAAGVATIYPDANTQLLPTMWINATQTGTGDPSPTNVRPIVGVDTVTATRCGVNLADCSDPVPYYCDWSYNLIPNDNRRSIIIPICMGTYRLTQTVETSIMRYGGLANCDAVRQPLIALKIGDAAMKQYNTSGATIVIDNPLVKALVITYWDNTSSATEAETAASLQVTVGSTTPTGYAPYTGTTYPVPLSTLTDAQGNAIGTQYGGYIEWARGKYVQTHAVTILNDNKYVAYTAFDVYESTRMLKANMAAVLQGSKPGCTLLCTHAPYTKYVSVGTCATSQSISGYFYWMFDYDLIGATSGVTNAQAVALYKQYLAAQYAAGTPVTVVYELATPIEYDITLPTITSLSGCNNLYHDANGTTAVTYHANAMHLIEQLQAAVIALGGTI